MGLKTHCLNGHEFSEANTYLRRDGNGRVCRACRNDRNRVWKAANRPHRMHEGHLPARIVDLLSIDGGWLTSEGIALALTAHPPTIQRTMERLRRMGFVTSRRVPLASNARGVDVRVEWADLDHPPSLF